MQFYDVAKVLTTHGLKGEVKVAAITDFPEQRFASGVKLALKDDHERVLTVVNGRPFKQFWLLTFKEITDIQEAEQLKGKILVISEDDQQQLPEGSYYYHDILGCSVIDLQTNKDIGKVIDIESPGANDIWLIKEKNGKDFWLPYIDEVVKRVDLEHHKIFVQLMEGLRDED